MKKVLAIFDKHYSAAFWALMGLMLAMLISAMLTGCGSISHFRTAANVNRPDPGTQELVLSGAYGSGFFVNRSGLALTAAHIFRGRVPHTERAFIWWTGRNAGLRVTPIVIDWNMDLALVQVATHRSKPVKPLCAEVVSGGLAVAIGAPDYKVSRNRGKVYGVFKESTPCESWEEEGGGISVRCGTIDPTIYTPGTDLEQSSSHVDQAAIIETTTPIKNGYSGGSLLYKPAGKEACTAGVIIQEGVNSKRARSIHPMSSPLIGEYLIDLAPKFMENFTN